MLLLLKGATGAVAHRATGTAAFAPNGTTTSILGNVPAGTTNGEVMWWAIGGNNTGALTLRNGSVVRDNVAQRHGGGVFNFGNPGNPAPNAVLVVANSAVIGNRATEGLGGG